MRKITVMLFMAILGVGLTVNAAQAGPASHGRHHTAGVTIVADAPVGPVARVSIFGVPPFFLPPPPPFIHGSVKVHRDRCDCGDYGYGYGHHPRYYRDYNRCDRRYHDRHHKPRRAPRSHDRGHPRHR
jgi:hypothetical protein